MNTIKKELNAERNSLIPWKIESDKRLYLNFNPISTDPKWVVELDYELFETSLSPENKLDKKQVIDHALVKLLSNFKIFTDLNFQKTNTPAIDNNGDDLVFNELIDKISHLQESSFISIVGENGSGKTTLIKQFCCQKTDAKIFWFDFNGSFTNFIDKLYELFTLNTSDFNGVFLILDNIDCCGLDTAQNIFEFFKEIVKIVRSTNKYMQLIIIQDAYHVLEYTATDYNTIFVSTSSVIKDLKNQNFDNLSKAPLPILLHNSYDKDNPSELAQYYIKIKDVETSFAEKRLIYKVILLSSMGIYVRLYNEETNIAKKLITYCTGMKLYSNNSIVFANKELSKLVLAQIDNNLWYKYKFDKAFNDEKPSNVAKKIIENYYNKTKLSLTNIGNILENNAYNYSQQSDKHKYLFDYIELIAMASNAKAHLIYEIEKSYLEGRGYFENHLGAILFAAEALAKYDDDWKALIAWKRLARFVRDTYYIDGQTLPEIKIDRKFNENTYVDFDNGPHSNSIKNQILLQNEVISMFGNEMNLSGQNKNECLAEDNFRYLLLQNKIDNDDILEINIEKFYKTYLLSLLYEFEVTAPQIELDEKRITILFNKIKNNIIENEENDTAYFYPARVPWVSARMLFALCETPTSLVALAPDIIRYKRRICKWLASCGYEIPIEDSTKYMIWLPGTGLWNGVLETTMMCTFAIKAAGGNDIVVQKGCNYILSQENSWFKNNSSADGIWACETILLNSSNQDSLLLAHNIMNKINFDSPSQIFTTKTEKPDRSLGDSHIAKTLISLAYKLSSKKPAIFIDNNAYEYSNKKAFISFETSTGCDVAQKIYDSIINNGTVQPYIYTQQMSAGNWKQQLKNAISITDVFILVISKRTFDSQPVLDELKIRFEMGGPILPVLCEDCNGEIAISDFAKTYLTQSEVQKLMEILDKKHNNVIDIAITKDYIQKVLQYIIN